MSWSARSTLLRVRSRDLVPRGPGASLRWIALGGWVFILACSISAIAAQHPGLSAERRGAAGPITHHAGAGDAHSMGSWPALVHTLMWVAMVAVMAPLITSNMRYAARRSKRAMQRRVVVISVASWAIVWAVAVGAVAVGLALMDHVLSRTGIVVVACAMALGWQASPAKKRAMVRCHRTIAPPLDASSALTACRRFGTRLGLDCVGGCWPAMLLMGAAGHSIIAVVPLTWLAFDERRRAHPDRRVGRSSAVIAATSIIALGATLLSA